MPGRRPAQDSRNSADFRAGSNWQGAGVERKNVQRMHLQIKADVFHRRADDGTSGVGACRAWDDVDLLRAQRQIQIQPGWNLDREHLTFARPDRVRETMLPCSPQGRGVVTLPVGRSRETDDAEAAIRVSGVCSRRSMDRVARTAASRAGASWRGSMERSFRSVKAWSPGMSCGRSSAGLGRGVKADPALFKWSA